jgi:DNA mismatch repair protein MLH3
MSRTLTCMQLPIRRVSHPSSSRTAELVRKDIATLALVSPSVTFIIDDLSKTTTGQTDRSRVLSVPRVNSMLLVHFLLTNDIQTSSMLTTFRQVHGRNLAEVCAVHQIRHTCLTLGLQHVEELDETSNGIRIQGFISLDGALSKVRPQNFVLYQREH